MQNPDPVNGNYVNNVRHEIVEHSGSTTKNKYLKDKNNEL
jgi:hypothetical protein